MRLRQGSRYRSGRRFGVRPSFSTLLASWGDIMTHFRCMFLTPMVSAGVLLLVAASCSAQTNMGGGFGGGISGGNGLNGGGGLSSGLGAINTGSSIGSTRPDRLIFQPPQFQGGVFAAGFGGGNSSLS